MALQDSFIDKRVVLSAKPFIYMFKFTFAKKDLKTG